MKVSDLNVVLLNVDDQELREGEKPLTVKRVMIMALGGSVPSDQQATAKDKEHCYDLLLQIKAAGAEVELDAEDVTLIKNRLAQLYGPIIVGQAVKLIEGKAPAGASKNGGEQSLVQP